MLSRHSVGTYQENELNATREEMLVHSHLKSLGHCGLLPGLKSGVDGHKLISTNNNNKIKNRKKKIKKNKKTAQAGTKLLSFPHISLTVRKKSPPILHGEYSAPPKHKPTCTTM